MLRFLMVLISFYVLLLSWSVNVGAQPPPITFQKIAMTWPKSFCKTDAPCDTGVKIPLHFTIHGIWPAYSDGNSPLPKDCPTSFQFNEEDLNPMKKDLEFWWPSFKMPNKKFWTAEWEKHGVCSGMSPVDYFKKGVNICSQVSNQLDTAFKKAGMAPGPTVHYTPMEYYNAIVNEFSLRPQIRCKEDKINKKKYLYEVIFCVDMNLNRQDCDKQGNLPGCGPYPNRFVTPIYFPS